MAQSRTIERGATAACPWCGLEVPWRTPREFDDHVDACVRIALGQAVDNGYQTTWTYPG